ncbi:MAG: flagellin lysine-N-methylase [Mobilitalea sp.]
MKTYIVPEYYEHFKCKCGDCRHSCCDGWPVRISMKEYYQLLGTECSLQLRTKLDCTLKVCSQPTKEIYAVISSNYQGVCMLHSEDGLCFLQSELGEEFLPQVCRLYPRNTKQISRNYECSCSNSCEAVIELLLHRKEPLLFQEKVLTRTPVFEQPLSSLQYNRCKQSISILQDRNLSLVNRLLQLGSFLYMTDINDQKPEHLFDAFQLLHTFHQYFEDSPSISGYSNFTQDYFSTKDKDELTVEDLTYIALKHRFASEQLDNTIPDWQILLEQCMINHMFYNSFPYGDNQLLERDAYLSLIIMYSFLRFNLLAYMSKERSADHLVDFLASMFRLIEHSNFKYLSVQLYKKETSKKSDCITQLIYV